MFKMMDHTSPTSAEVVNMWSLCLCVCGAVLPIPLHALLQGLSAYFDYRIRYDDEYSGINLSMYRKKKYW